MAERERRAHPRESLTRPCKLYVPRIGRYVSGQTSNLSEGGALVWLDRDGGLEPGDSIFLGVAMLRRQVVLTSSQMHEARVERVMRTTDEIGVAARYVVTDVPRRLAA